MSGSSAFESWTNSDLIELIDQHPLAWVVSGQEGFAATPLPMLLECDAEGRPVTLLGHFSRANPQVECIRAEPRTLFLFSGPSGYISPELLTTTRDWAPTWNYAVARIVADVEFIEELADEALASLVGKMEAGRARPWSPNEMGARYHQLKRHIIAFRARIQSVEARFKLGQDERPEVLGDIVTGLGKSNLAQWMRRFNPRLGIGD